MTVHPVSQQMSRRSNTAPAPQTEEKALLEGEGGGQIVNQY